MHPPRKSSISADISTRKTGVVAAVSFVSLNPRGTMNRVEQSNAATTLSDAFERFDALVAKLRADAGAVVYAYVRRPPVTEQEIAEVEHAIKAPLHPSILTFFRQSNGVQFYADRRDRKGFVEVAVDGDKPAVAIAKLRQNFQRSYGLDIPSLREVFLTDVVDQLALEVEPMTFGDEEFPSAFVRTLRLLDKSNPYHPVCAALFERPGNPRIGAGDDYGVTFDATRVTDFETFISTFLKEGGLRERMEAFFRA